MVRISTRVATSPFQSNSLRGQGEDIIITSCLVGQEGHCFLVIDLDEKEAFGGFADKNDYEQMTTT